MGRGGIKLGMPHMFHVSFLSCRLHNDAEAISDRPRQVGRRDFPTSGEIPAATRQLGSERRRREALPLPPRPPPASPAFDQAIHGSEKKTTTAMKTKSESCNTTMPTTTASSTDSPCFFSSDGEEEAVAPRRRSFKQLSFSSSESDSSPEFLIPRRTSKRRGTSAGRRRKPRCSNRQSSALKMPPGTAAGGRVEESVAVTKRSTDPYADFRSSMVEMIVEKEIVRAEELEQLLDCFLSLNSPYYHRIILDAFEEICEALFRNWC